MKKIKFILVIILLLLLGVLLVVWPIQPQTPLNALEKEYMNKGESILQYTHFIEQIDINSKESLLFYLNGNENVNCAVAVKKINGYKIVDVNGELEPYQDDWRAALYGSTYGKVKKWVYFGIIYDDAVEKVVWNNVEAIRFSALTMDMFYAIGNGPFEGQEYYLYDSDGNKLEYISYDNR